MDKPVSESINLPGGLVCLSFTNTVEWHTGPQPEERLTTYSDLLSWSRRAGILTAGEAAQLEREGKRRPAEAGEILRRALEFREALFRTLRSAVQVQRPASDDLAVLNRVLSEALARIGIAPEGQGFTWTWRDPSPTPELILWRVATSAAELLVSSDLDRVRVCADERCGWLFLDTSRNRSRRWCSMKDCGNRAKARRHYQRLVSTAFNSVSRSERELKK